MNYGAIEAWLDSMGLMPPGGIDIDMAIVAAALTIAFWLGGWYLGRRMAVSVNHFLDERVGAENAQRTRLVERVIRYGLISILLATLFGAWPWDTLSSVIVGGSLAVSSTLFIYRMVRFLRMPSWAAAVLSGAVFVLILSQLLGGIEPVFDALDQVGFDAGDMRISLLGILRILITAILIFAVVRLLNRLVHHSVANASHLDPTQSLLVEKLVGVGVLVVAFFVGVDILGIDLTALAVFSGAFGLAIGFGFQKTFGNLISGIILLMDRSIKPGDVIVVGESFGWVSKIGIRAVSVITRDGKEHLIPNEILMTEEVENWSFSSRNVRIHIPVGVSYNADMDLAEKLMRQAAEESPRILDSPQTNVWMTEYGDSSVNFEILAWIRDPEEGVGNVKSDVLKRLWKLFREHDIEIPFPQRDVHIRDIPREWQGKTVRPVDNGDQA